MLASVRTPACLNWGFTASFSTARHRQTLVAPSTHPYCPHTKPKEEASTESLLCFSSTHPVHAFLLSSPTSNSRFHKARLQPVNTITATGKDDDHCRSSDSKPLPLNFSILSSVIHFFFFLSKTVICILFTKFSLVLNKKMK